MINLKKYSPIENVFTQDFMDKVMADIPADAEWVVQKKDDGGRYLSVDEANAFFEAEGFFYAKTLFRGSLAECLKYPNAFQSKISQWLGLPDIEDNICEGIVVTEP